MSKKISKVSTVAAQQKRTDSSDTIASGTVQRRKRKTHCQVFSEGFDAGVRGCVETLLSDGNDRDCIAGSFDSNGIPFPFTNDPIWNGSWEFEDWDDWVAAEE